MVANIIIAAYSSLLYVFFSSPPIAPKLGEDGVVSESQPLSDNLLPREVGLRKLPVVYSCLDASLQYLVVGSAQGYVFVVDVKAMTLLKEFNVSCLAVQVLVRNYSHLVGIAVQPSRLYLVWSILW